MSHQPAHCPFLNRSDARCSDALNLQHLDHAFAYCFGRYKSCPVYLELLVARRLKRRQAAAQHDVTLQRPLVQVTVHAAGVNRITQFTADDPIAPAVSSL